MKDSTVGIRIVTDRPWITVSIEGSPLQAISIEDAKVLIDLLRVAIHEAEKLRNKDNADQKKVSVAHRVRSLRSSLRASAMKKSNGSGRA